MSGLRAVILAVLTASACATEVPIQARLDLAAAELRDLGVPDLAPVDDMAVPEPPSPDMAGWHSVPVPVDAGDESLRGVWAEPAAAWVVGGSSLILRYDGETASIEPAPPSHGLRAVVTSTSRLWAVGDSGSALERLDGGWSDESPGGATLYGAWGHNPSALVTVGASGTVEVFAGYWRSWSLPSTPDLYGVWFHALENDGIIYVVGADGTVETTSLPSFHGVWTPLDSGTTSDLFGVWGDDTQLFIVGANGTILRSTDWATFTPESSGTSATLFSVSGAMGEVWAVGAGGTILHRHGGAWSLERSEGADLRGVWVVSSTEAWAVGDRATVLHFR